MAQGFKTGGRKKGTPNKLSRDLKEMILGALDDAGGRKYLAKQAITNPNAFLVLVGKVLPLNINATVKHSAADYTEDELRQIIGGSGAVDANAGEEEPRQLH